MVPCGRSRGLGTGGSAIGGSDGDSPASREDMVERKLIQTLIGQRYKHGDHSTDQETDEVVPCGRSRGLGTGGSAIPVQSCTGKGTFTNYVIKISWILDPPPTPRPSYVHI